MTTLKGVPLKIGAVFFLIFATPLAGLLADIVYLKDGSIFKGTVGMTADNKITVQNDMGNISIDKTKVDRIEYNTETPSSAAPVVQENLQRKEDLRTSSLGFNWLLALTYYFGGDPYADIKKRFDDNIDILDSDPNYDVTGSFSGASTGWGGTVGALWSDKKLEWGPTFTLIGGPEGKAEITVADQNFGYIVAQEDTKIHTNYYRPAFFIRKNIPISEAVQFTLSADAGYTWANMSLSGEGAPSQDWSGFTWMLSPGLRFGRAKQMTFDIGYNYLKLPAKESSDKFDKFEWSPSGAYVQLTLFVK